MASYSRLARHKALAARPKWSKRHLKTRGPEGRRYRDFISAERSEGAFPANAATPYAAACGRSTRDDAFLHHLFVMSPGLRHDHPDNGGTYMRFPQRRHSLRLENL